MHPDALTIIPPNLREVLQPITTASKPVLKATAAIKDDWAWWQFHGEQAPPTAPGPENRRFGGGATGDTETGGSGGPGKTDPSSRTNFLILFETLSQTQLMGLA